jgi:hypothetical protein
MIICTLYNMHFQRYTKQTYVKNLLIFRHSHLIMNEIFYKTHSQITYADTV